jgi:hypothetical protein
VPGCGSDDDGGDDDIDDGSRTLTYSFTQPCPCP